MITCCNGHPYIHILEGEECPVCVRDQEIYALKQKLAEAKQNFDCIVSGAEKLLEKLKGGK